MDELYVAVQSQKALSTYSISRYPLVTFEIKVNLQFTHINMCSVVYCRSRASNDSNDRVRYHYDGSDSTVADFFFCKFSKYSSLYLKNKHFLTIQYIILAFLPCFKGCLLCLHNLRR